MDDLLAGRRKPFSIYPVWTLSRNRVDHTALLSLTHSQGTVRFAYLNKHLFSRYVLGVAGMVTYNVGLGLCSSGSKGGESCLGRLVVKCN